MLFPDSVEWAWLPLEGQSGKSVVPLRPAMDLVPPEMERTQGPASWTAPPTQHFHSHEM